MSNSNRLIKDTIKVVLIIYTLAQDLNAFETTLERHAWSGNHQGTTPKTIPSKEQFHKVALKILIQISEEKDSAIRWLD
jgi:hypothetical protein